jgi:hypothetical protein
MNEDIPRPDYSGTYGYSYELELGTGWSEAFAKFWDKRGMGPTGFPRPKAKQRKPPRKVDGL